MHELKGQQNHKECKMLWSGRSFNWTQNLFISKKEGKKSEANTLSKYMTTQKAKTITEGLYRQIKNKISVQKLLCNKKMKIQTSVYA